MGCIVMVVYTYEISKEHNIYPNLTVCDRLRDGVPMGYRLTPNKGFVFQDTRENFTELDEETGEEIPVTYYRTLAYLPRDFRFDSFPFVAVPEST